MRLIDANKFQETLDKAWNEPEYQHEGEDWRSGVLAFAWRDVFLIKNLL